jgi:uncharacterized delta-60 repeat protein
LAAPLRAGDGDVDTSFGTSGITAFDLGNTIDAFAVAGGRLPAGGYWWAARMTDPNGAFGFVIADAAMVAQFTCHLTPPPGASSLWMAGAALDGAGRLVLAGTADITNNGVTTDGVLVLARFANPASNCNLDAGFGTGQQPGWSYSAFPSPLTLGAGRIAIDRLGGITAVGTLDVDPITPVSQAVVVRFLAGGQLDTSFNGTGYRSFSLTGGNSQGIAVAVSENPLGTLHFWLGGNFDHNAGGRIDADFLVIKLTANGTVEQTTIEDVGNAQKDDLLAWVACDPSRHRLWAVGLSAATVLGTFVTRASVARFTDAGVLDTGFSGDGRLLYTYVTTVDTMGVPRARRVVVQSDGKPIIAGSYASSGQSPPDFAVTRLLPDGDIDATFHAPGGRIIVPFDLGSTNEDVATSLLLPGRILVAGEVADDPSLTRIGLLQLQTSLIFADGFESGATLQWSAAH